MAENYVLLETIQLTQNASSVTLDNIPQSGYTDLKVVMSLRKTDNTTLSSSYVTFNGSTSGYSYRRLFGNGTSANSDTNVTGTSSMYLGSSNSATSTANTFSNTELYVLNYLSSTNKPVSIDMMQEDNASAGYQFMITGLWANSSAINSMTFTGDGSYVAGSTFSIYGIASLGTTPVASPSATGGNIVVNDGTYWYHAFLRSGYFTPLKTLNCDVLTIAGGGSGGCNSAGGGGAGGLVHTGGTSFATSAYAVAVGAGGAGVTRFEVKGNNGTNSTVTGAGISLTAAVGGGGGGARTGGSNPSINNGSTGGSGGGGAGQDPTAGSGGASTSGQGNAGGSGFNSASTFPGGGGGGAGAVGGTATSSNGGTGGIGSATYSSWGSVTLTGQNSGGTYYYAGGGGGSAAWNSGSATRGDGGLGGGGNGGQKDTSAGVAGTANTGGGGGGGSNSTTNSSNVSGAGGSGIVIIRYLMV